MRRLIIALLLLSSVAFAQTTPVLHSRRDAAPLERTRATKAVSTIPADASGEYELDDKGSVIQITIEHGRLTGYITEMDHNTALTLFFNQTAIDGNRLSFNTKTVHDVRYSFHGTILRGDAQSRSMNGFYRLTGDLTAHRNAGSRTQRVSLKSTPRD